MSLEKTIKEISNQWIEYRSYCRTTSKIGVTIKKARTDHITYDLIEKDWPGYIRQHVNSNRYKVDSSVGQGVLGAIPWLTIMDKSITESATKGYYVVYLFSRSAKKLYLCIGLAATQFQDIYGMNNKCLGPIENGKNYFSELFKKYEPPNTLNEIDLLEDDLDFEEPLKSTSRNLVSCYEKGTIFIRQYDISQITNEVLISDLKEYVHIYSKIVDDPDAQNLDFLAERTFDEKKLTKEKINFDYDIPPIKPRKPKKKKKKKSTATTPKQSKNKRRTQESHKIGLAGENYVYEYEYKKLEKIGRKDLADQIKKHCELREYPGWDITSYDENGNEIYIEVKSTKGKKIDQLDITNNEWNGAIQKKDNYYIYLVKNALNENINIFEKICNPAKLVESGVIEISPSVYELQLYKTTI